MTLEATLLWFLWSASCIVTDGNKRPDLTVDFIVYRQMISNYARKI